MTFSRWTKIVETPQGTGTIFDGTKAIKDVKYDLIVEVEDFVAKSFNMKKVTPLKSTTRIKGTISAVKKDITSYIGSAESPASLKLVLEDGREIYFSVVDPTPIDGKYLIICTGEFKKSTT